MKEKVLGREWLQRRDGGYTHKNREQEVML